MTFYYCQHQNYDYVEVISDYIFSITITIIIIIITNEISSQYSSKKLSTYFYVSSRLESRSALLNHTSKIHNIKCFIYLEMEIY